jgi:hypothetical protein
MIKIPGKMLFSINLRFIILRGESKPKWRPDLYG